MPIVKEEFNAARRSEMLLIIGDLRYLSPIIKNRELFMTLLDYGFFSIYRYFIYKVVGECFVLMISNNSIVFPIEIIRDGSIL